MLKNTNRLLIVFCLLATVTFAVPVSAAKSSGKVTAQTQSADLSSTVPQSYEADSSVQVGMIVKLKDNDPKTVVPLPSGQETSMLGIVVPRGSAPIELTQPSSSQQQVLVATSGHSQILVSNQQGPIKTGDYLTISALDGVAMKASENQPEVVGKAAGNFSGTSNVIGSVALSDTLGRKDNVALGRIPVDIAISHNPLFSKSYDYVPGFLSKSAQAVASHPVSVARIYLSMTVMFITALVTGNMLYSGVKSGILAVGRNPLSRKSIIKSLIQTVIAGLIIFVAGVFAVYLLLKL